MSRRRRVDVADHDGMSMRAAEHLQDRLAPLLPEYDLSSVPWHDEDGEWIVTVWDDDGLALIDVFRREAGYVLRRVGSRQLIGHATLEGIPAMVRTAVRPRSS